MYTAPPTPVQAAAGLGLVVLGLPVYYDLMLIVDIHNHYHPTAYLDALLTGPSAVGVSVDADGNPLTYYPGDYNICVPEHRDIDVLKEHGVDVQAIAARGLAASEAERAGIFGGNAARLGLP